MLSAAERLKIIARVQKAVLKHHVNLANVDLEAWSQEFSASAPSLATSESDHVFDKGITDLLAKLKSSHTDFYCSNRQPVRPEHAIGATLRSVTVGDGQKWMFLDVFEDGAANERCTVRSGLGLSRGAIARRTRVPARDGR